VGSWSATHMVLGGRLLTFLSSADLVRKLDMSVRRRAACPERAAMAGDDAGSGAGSASRPRGKRSLDGDRAWFLFRNAAGSDGAAGDQAEHAGEVLCPECGAGLSSWLRRLPIHHGAAGLRCPGSLVAVGSWGGLGPIAQASAGSDLWARTKSHRRGRGC
jgi:hypothetical protein